ncbi:MAG: RNA polymerase sigma factor [Pseudomonadota bacterium]
MDPNEELGACIPRLRRYARALLGARGGADDLVQDTLERAWRKLHLWRRGAELRPWLFSIMHNLYVDQARRYGVDTLSLDEVDLDIPVRATQEDLVEVHDLQGALALLPAEQRQVLLLVALEQMAYKDVARTLDIPLGTVMSRLSRGRERLRELMEGRPRVVPLKVVR